jgi:hypothetical protein
MNLHVICVVAALVLLAIGAFLSPAPRDRIILLGLIALAAALVL